MVHSEFYKTRIRVFVLHHFVVSVLNPELADQIMDPFCQFRKEGQGEKWCEVRKRKE